MLAVIRYWMDNQVSNRLSSNNFTLPLTAWQNLLSSDKLYYRIGTTSSPQQDQWNNFMISTYDDESYKAPYLQLEALAIDEDYGRGSSTDEEHKPSEEASISRSVGRGGRNASEVRMSEPYSSYSMALLMKREILRPHCQKTV